MAEVQVQGWGTSAAPNDRKTKDSERLEVVALEATFDGSGATGPFIPAVQIISDSGAEVGTFPLASSLAVGDSATVTFAPFLGRAGNAITGQHAGYYWFNTAAATAGVGPGGGTSWGADWNSIQKQWGDSLLNITNPLHPAVTQDGFYTFSFEVRLITGRSIVGDYAAQTVLSFVTFTTVPSPLFGNLDIRFPAQITRDWTFPRSSSAFACFMRAGDSFAGGFETTQATLAAEYLGFADVGIVIAYLAASDLTP